MAFPRYTTFPQGTLPEGAKPAPIRGLLLKEHTFLVTYPDGAEGACRYTRYGPRWHRFDYRHGDGPGGSALPHRYSSEPLGNTRDDVETKGREMAAKAFADAVERERKDRFAWATPAHGQKPDPSLYVLSAGDAKRLGGRYALCLPLPVSGRLIRSSAVFATLEEANAAFDLVGDGRLVVCCCHRLNRRWERPRYGAKGGSEQEEATP